MNYIFYKTIVNRKICPEIFERFLKKYIIRLSELNKKLSFSGLDFNIYCGSWTMYKPVTTFPVFIMK
jgi:hypothetical protein